MTRPTSHGRCSLYLKVTMYLIRLLLHSPQPLRMLLSDDVVRVLQLPTHPSLYDLDPRMGFSDDVSSRCVTESSYRCTRWRVMRHSLLEHVRAFVLFFPQSLTASLVAVALRVPPSEFYNTVRYCGCHVLHFVELKCCCLSL